MTSISKPNHDFNIFILFLIICLIAHKMAFWRPFFSFLYVVCQKLYNDDRVGWANCFASSAINTNIFINNVNFPFRDTINWAFCLTCTTSDTCFNYSSWHNMNLLIVVYLNYSLCQMICKPFFLCFGNVCCDLINIFQKTNQYHLIQA
jgi:hypothetical protein